MNKCRAGIKVDPERNPGGNAVVIAVGAAAPLKTPVIGLPARFTKAGEPLR